MSVVKLSITVDLRRFDANHSTTNKPKNAPVCRSCIYYLFHL